MITAARIIQMRRAMKPIGKPISRTDNRGTIAGTIAAVSITIARANTETAHKPPAGAAPPHRRSGEARQRVTVTEIDEDRIADPHRNRRRGEPEPSGQQ